MSAAGVLVIIGCAMVIVFALSWRAWNRTNGDQRWLAVGIAASGVAVMCAVGANRLLKAHGATPEPLPAPVDTCRRP